MKCPTCRGDGLHPIQDGGLTRVCRRCGGAGNVRKQDWDFPPIEQTIYDPNHEPMGKGPCEEMADRGMLEASRTIKELRARNEVLKRLLHSWLRLNAGTYVEGAADLEKTIQDTCDALEIPLDYWAKKGSKRPV